MLHTVTNHHASKRPRSSVGAAGADVWNQPASIAPTLFGDGGVVKVEGCRVPVTSLVSDVLAALTGSQGLSDALQHCAQAIVDDLGAAFARIWALNEATQILELQASAGMYTHLDGPHGRVPVGALKIGRIAQERQAHLTNDVLDDDRISDRDWARANGMVAFAGYPLVVGRRVVGVVAMFARHELSRHTLDSLASVADSIALAIAHWRTEEQLRDENRILDNLHRLGTAIASELDLERVMHTVTDAATELTGAQFGAFIPVSGALYEPFANFPLPRNTALFAPTFRGEGIIRLNDVRADVRYCHEVPPHGTHPLRSYLAVPVVAHSGEVLGGLFFGHPDPAVFTQRDERIVEGIAGYAGVAIRNARMYEREHRVALALQQSLLPNRLPELECARLAGCYLPASAHADVGGDWYDAMLLADGRLVISVGDVMGHDLQAAAVMGQVRTALRAYLLDGHAPADALVVLDRFMTDARIKGFATTVVVSYNPINRALEAVSAGHLPPLLILHGGDSRFLEMSPLPPVGCRLIDSRTAGAATAHSTMPAGSTLVLFTDGLVERRGEPLDDGLERLKAAATALAGLTPEEMCHYLAKEFADARCDDVALLIVQPL